MSGLSSGSTGARRRGCRARRDVLLGLLYLFDGAQHRQAVTTGGRDGLLCAPDLLRASSSSASASCRARSTAASRSSSIWSSRRAISRCWAAGFIAQVQRCLALVAGCIALGLNCLEQIFDLVLRRGQQCTRTAQDVLRQSQALRDRQRVAAAREADHQAVGGAKLSTSNSTEAFCDARRLVGERLQLRVVGRARSTNPPSTRNDRIERASAEPSCGSVPAPSSSSSTRSAVGVAQHLDDVAHVRGEGREALLDALLVADVREDLLEDRDARIPRRPGSAARLRHQRQQAHRLERHRLATRVGPVMTSAKNSLSRGFVDYGCIRWLGAWIGASAHAELDVSRDNMP